MKLINGAEFLRSASSAIAELRNLEYISRQAMLDDAVRAAKKTKDWHINQHGRPSHRTTERIRDEFYARQVSPREGYPIPLNLIGAGTIK